MPRTARLDTPGLLHHVMIRGIERSRIFFDHQDRENLIERLALLLPETGTRCYAWAFLPNHAHFLFQSGRLGISTLMRRLLTGYAVSFNRRHDRHGQLFQNRYKSIICEEDPYLHELVRYIHLNPLRSKVVSSINELDTYRFCGHSALMGNVVREWQDDQYVLRFFGDSIGIARRKYRLFVEEGEVLGRRADFVKGALIRSQGVWDEVKEHCPGAQDRIKSDQRILGESAFIEDVLADSAEAFSRRCRIKSRGVTFEHVVERVSKLYNLDKDYIIGKGRQGDRVRARDLVCYWSVAQLGMSLTDVAKRLDLTLSAVGYAVRRGEKESKQGRLNQENLVIELFKDVPDNNEEERHG